MTAQVLVVVVVRVAKAPLKVTRFTAKDAPKLIGFVGGAATSAFLVLDIEIETFKGAAGPKVSVDPCVAVKTQTPGLIATTEEFE